MPFLEAAWSCMALRTLCMHLIGLPSKPSLLTFSGEGNFFLCKGRRMNVMQLLQTLRQIYG
jgi:hypothetical protein